MKGINGMNLGLKHGPGKTIVIKDISGTIGKKLNINCILGNTTMSMLKFLNSIMSLFPVGIY